MRQFGNILKRGSRYRASFKNPRAGEAGEPRRIGATFARKTEADRWLAAQQTAIERGTWTSPLQQAKIAESEKARTLTFSAYAERYLETLSIKATSMRPYKSNYRNHLAPKWGDWLLIDIDKASITAWLHSELSPEHHGARKKAFELFKSIMARAYEDDLIEQMPFTRAMTSFVNRVSKSQGHKPIALEVEQLEALLDALPEYMRLFAEIQGYWGLRIGEAQELRRSDVDWDRGVIYIQRRVYRLGGRMTVDIPKTDGSVRVIYPSADYMARVKEHLHRLPVVGKEQLLFPSSSNPCDYLPATTFAHTLERVCAQLGLPRLSPHDLRHTALTLAARIEGVSLADVQALAGHASPIMTMRYQVTGERAQRRIGEGLADLRKRIVM